jgi:Domain of unknown function (DUF4281)
MSVDLIFNFCQGLALIGWLALVAAPLNRSLMIGAARGIALVLAVAYLAQLFGNTVPVEGGSFMTIGGITALFSQSPNVMLGWTHFLVFDLFVGSWIAEDADREAFPHWAVIPLLFATLMIGPVGLLIWFIVRSIHRARLGRLVA